MIASGKQANKEAKMESKIQVINGNRMIVIDGEIYTPVAYRSFRPMPSNIYRFSRSGVKLYQIQVSGRNSTLKVPYSTYDGKDVLTLQEDGEYKEMFSGKIFKTHEKGLEFDHYAHQVMMFVKM